MLDRRIRVNRDAPIALARDRYRERNQFTGFCVQDARIAARLTQFTIAPDRLLKCDSVTDLLLWVDRAMHDSTNLYRPFRERLDAFVHNLGRVEEGDIEVLHRTRVASRRLRELLPLLELDRDTTRKLTRRLRKVTRQLGTVRELDVLTLLIQELSEDGRHSPTALMELGATAAQARAAARERLYSKLPTAKLERLARNLERVAKNLESANTKSGRIGARGPRRAWVWASEARVARRAGGVRAAIEAAGAVYAPEHLHGLRIAFKKLRYAAELAAEATHKGTAADIAVLKAAQDLLGRLHDVEMFLVLAREAYSALSPSDLTAWRDLGSLVHVVEDDCRGLHARYMRDRAALIAIANRMGAGTREAQRVSRRAAG
jgi:CHAD domain-containing protein